jgi:hypothetical protein
MIQSVTLDRASLSLAALVIDNDPFAGHFHLPEGGLSRPGFAVRRTYAPDSAWTAGRQLLAAVSDAGTLPLTIHAHGDTATELEAAIDELEAATSQFTYPIAVDIDGVSRTWAADPELPQWGAVDSGLVGAHMAIATISIPLNPL